ncbi:nitrous oxide reductase accessory protein NosL [Aureivirga sp. CE67]|uniref:nitrous oxide reductase accessory protein NosL n=1 Tax=Aureivirga sp. CE67 TaxID=1788983 RepID=UPI0018CB85D4|nr:nitrous oxide reductase accessory protein NosL [Aureivirga sp. CE67]
MRILIISLVMLLFISCEVKQQPIEYGSDACHFCKMTIVDKQHASELVTNKGKAYKFDAIECLVNYINEGQISSEDFGLLLVSNYPEKDHLVDAKTATYLISEKIPSPMGYNLSAFEKKEDATAMQKAKGGQIFTWNELIEKIK